MASEVIRIRDNGLCRRCRKPTRSVHHIFSRVHRFLRWDLDNLLLLCFACHAFAHREPHLFSDWVQGQIGNDTFERLKVLAYSQHGKVDVGMEMVRLMLYIQAEKGRCKK